MKIYIYQDFFSKIGLIRLIQKKLFHILLPHPVYIFLSNDIETHYMTKLFLVFSFITSAVPVDFGHSLSF